MTRQAAPPPPRDDGAGDPIRAHGHVRVGVAVLLFRDGSLLLGERLGSHGAGTWAPPGGGLEFGESPEACAGRELAEETGLGLATVARGPYTVDLFASERRHYVTLFMLGTVAAGDEPSLLEPAKCAGWHWCPWAALPAPLFAPLASLVAGGFVPPPSPPHTAHHRSPHPLPSGDQA